MRIVDESWQWVMNRVVPRQALAVPSRASSNHTLHDGMRDPEVRVYGHRGTIHNTERVDVEVNAAGECVAVWFRCQQLPFKQSFADGKRASDMNHGSQVGLPRLVAVEVID